MCEGEHEIIVNCKHDTREIVNCLDRLVSAVERIAKGVERLPAFAGVTHYVPVGEDSPRGLVVEGADPTKPNENPLCCIGCSDHDVETDQCTAPVCHPDNVADAIAGIPQAVLPKASDYTESQRAAIVKELDELGAEYKPRARTNTLHAALIEARELKAAGDKIDAEENAAPATASTPGAEDLAEYRGKVRDMLIDFAYKRGTDKARAFVKAYGEDKKVENLTREQLEEIERKLTDEN